MKRILSYLLVLAAVVSCGNSREKQTANLLKSLCEMREAADRQWEGKRIVSKNAYTFGKEFLSDWKPRSIMSVGGGWIESYLERRLVKEEPEEGPGFFYF